MPIPTPVAAMVAGRNHCWRSALTIVVGGRRLGFVLSSLPSEIRIPELKSNHAELASK
jgi:hypothetical protein